MKLTRTRVVLGGVAVTTLLGASAAMASSSTITVSTGSINGTRTLQLLDPTGGSLAGALPIGTGNSGSFVASVVDANYKHVGYQVTSTMTNLYPYSSGTYSIGTTNVPSSGVGVSFPTQGLQLDNVTDLVQPVFTIAGNLTGTLGLTALSLLLPGTNLTTFSTTVDGMGGSVTTAAAHVLDGSLTTLPVSVQHGIADSYTTPATLAANGTVNETGAKSVLLMDGTAQTIGASTLNAALPAATSVTNLISQGWLSQSAVLQAVANALAIPVVDLTTAVIAPLTGTATGTIGGVLGQTGSYNTVPQLHVTVPSTVPSGTYQGVLTVTLADK